MPSSVVVDGFFGDCGKGKVTSHLALRDKATIVARGGVGPNAGHTVIFRDRTYRLSQLPSGFVYESARLLIGPGVLVNPNTLLEEVELTRTSERVGVDPNCGIIEDRHIQEDKTSSHLRGKIGTTGTGCGPAQRDRASRTLKMARDIDSLSQLVCDVPGEINDALDEEKSVVLEGSQGTFISLFHGTYPYVTSKDVTASSICADVGLGPKRLDEVILVLKAYVTRVGAGPLENELTKKEAQERGRFEVATVTGRERRSAPFDYQLAERAVMLNSATQLAVTALDVLYPKDRGKTRWKDLTEEGTQFIRGVEEKLNVPVTLIGTGPKTRETVDRTV